VAIRLSDSVSQSPAALTTYHKPLSKPETRLLGVDEIAVDVSTVTYAPAKLGGLPPERIDHHEDDLIKGSFG